MRVMTRVTVGLAIVIGYVSMIGGECDGDQVSVDLEAVRFLDVRLVNGGNAPIHLFSGDEAFPCCQVAVGGERMVNRAVEPLARLRFRAGRNGTTSGAVSCMVDDAYETLDTVTVLWTGASLVCTGNW